MLKQEKPKKEVKKSTKYADLLSKGIKDGSTKEVIHEHHEWDGEGDMLVGKLISQQVVESKKFKGQYIKYLFETDDGLKTCICGYSVDSILGIEDYTGSIIALTYLGKKEIDTGNRVNEFQLIIVERQHNPKPE